jgi:GNAT superfamily N-acetyltransferase
VIVREVLPDEAEMVGALRVATYAAGDPLAVNSAYADTLRALGFGGSRGTVLVAVDENDGRLLGTVMLDPWGPGSEIALCAGEAEVRALAVAPPARGQGVAGALVMAVINAAVRSGMQRLLLSTCWLAPAAWRSCKLLGFIRTPERDWAPQAGFPHITYELPLDGARANLPAKTG